MTKELSNYNAAKQALALAKTVDEVKDIRDKAMAMRLYAQQAKDKTLEQDALEIRLRAEARLGQMMDEEREAGRLKQGRRWPDNGLRENPLPTLASQGINKPLAHRARTFARMKPEEFENYIRDAREHLTLIQRSRWNDPLDTERLPKVERLVFELHVVRDYIYQYRTAEIQRLLQSCTETINAISKHLQEENVTKLADRSK